VWTSLVVFTGGLIYLIVSARFRPGRETELSRAGITDPESRTTPVEDDSATDKAATDKVDLHKKDKGKSDKSSKDKDVKSDNDVKEAKDADGKTKVEAVTVSVKKDGQDQGEAVTVSVKKGSTHDSADD
jgi:cytoskeletal protein RodZ